jgi:NADH-quinone oxidoreductase subunit A
MALLPRPPFAGAIRPLERGEMNGDVLWPLVVYAGLVFGLVAGMMAGSHFLGERHNGRATVEPYESGIAPTGEARARMPAPFYLIAMFFVIFDLETVFVLSWAVAARELGWAGYVEAMVFLGVLLLSLGYLWRLGALDWGPTPRFPRAKRRG